MGQADYTKIKQYYLKRFEQQNSNKLSNTKQYRNARKSVQSHTNKILEIEKEIEDLRPELDNLSNLDAIFSLGGQKTPIDNPVSRELQSKKDKLKTVKQELKDSKKKYAEFADEELILSDTLYKRYNQINNSGLERSKIKEIPQYDNYEDLDDNLAYIFVLTHMEENDVAGIAPKYLKGLSTENLLQNIDGYEELKEQLARIELKELISRDFDDTEVRACYEKLSNKTKATATYERFCLNYVNLIGMTYEKAVWIAEKANAFFKQTGNGVFSKSDITCVEDVINYIISVSRTGYDVTADIWKDIRIPEHLLEDNGNINMITVPSAFKTFTVRYVRNIKIDCYNAKGISWYNEYNSVRLNQNMLEYRSVMDKLVDYEIAKALEGKKFWDGIAYKRIISNVTQCDANHPVLRDEFKRLKKEARDTSREATASEIKVSVGHAIEANRGYRLTSAHMIIILTIMAYITFFAQSSSFLVLVMESGINIVVGLGILFFLHTNDKRMAKAETIISSPLGFVINTVILGGLAWILRMYFTKLGMPSDASFKGMMIAAVAYALYLLMVVFVRKTGGDKK